ncbi:hypothetical protein CAPTEDRAFT_223313 [Capitella teleta]|uniref:Protein brambleberry n=1 Tax=Capitella teleta TaxID=283909 RepID=R7T386_CAPTE|nr:hypothetical protein CAPTEDRAFT_223313 [Capitella teleta]|eukprot:ELT87036.1 hypothetical protein CAPTEDRAFT_223313 [Capitella teleta]
MHFNRRFAFIFITMISCHSVVQADFIKWLFSDPDSDNQLAGDREDPASERQATPATSSVPFEMTIGDEKFQLQAQFVKDLSPLDYCHHKVIHNIRDACGDMTEEQMGKLAVHLLNCQLDAEKRETYLCNQEMTLAECTQSMDATVWNAYQIVSNRARAVCYAARQQQFRMRTEMTVNTLVETAESQLLSMLRMEESQRELKTATEDTLDVVHRGQERIVAAHGHLERTQAQISSSMSSNMYALMREKALIAAGNQELTEMTEAIKEKLDVTANEISNQGSQQKLNHEELIRDLDTIRQRAKAVWEKIDESTQDVLVYQEQTRKHYTDTIDNLSRINNTIANVYTALMHQKEVLENFIDWVVGFLGGTGDSVAILQVFFLHIGYLVLAAISASFLKTPIFTRVLLLIIVPMNALAELRGDSVQSLSFAAMTALIVLTTVVEQESITFSGLNTPDVKKLLNILEKMYESGTLSPQKNNVEQGSGDSVTHEITTKKQIYEQAKRDLMISLQDPPVNNRVDSPRLSTPLVSEKRSATPVNGSPRSSRALCLSTTKNNRPCKLMYINEMPTLTVYSASYRNKELCKNKKKPILTATRQY